MKGLVNSVVFPISSYYSDQQLASSGLKRKIHIKTTTTRAHLGLGRQKLVQPKGEFDTTFSSTVFPDFELDPPCSATLTRKRIKARRSGRLSQPHTRVLTSCSTDWLLVHYICVDELVYIAGFLLLLGPLPYSAQQKTTTTHQKPKKKKKTCTWQLS